jgi:PAS domain S-box-containing protein
MTDQDRTREQLLEEVRALRGRLEQTEKRLRDSEEAYRTLVETTTDGLTTVDQAGTIQDITERKQAEEKLRRSAALLAEAERLAHLGSWERDLLTNTLTWSEELYRIFGVRPDEFGLTFAALLERVHPEDRAAATAIAERALQTHAPFEYSYRIVRPDGTVRTVEGCGQVVTDSNAQAVRLVGAILDVTDRRRAEEALEESRRRFQAVFENSLDGILLMDDSGRYVDVNPAMCQLLGYRRDELLQLTVWDITPAPDRNRIPELLTRFLAAGTLSGEYTLLCKGGGTRVAEYRAVANILPGLHLAVHRDITERKRAEERLRESEEKFHQLAQNIEGYFWLNATDDSQMYYMSPGYEKVCGRSCQSLYECPESWTDVIHPGDRERVLAVARVPLGEAARELEYRIVRPDGAVRWIRDRAFPVRNSAGEVYRVAGFGEDITERKQAEEKLREYYERVQALSGRLVEVQEEERRHLARELHDEIGQLLTSLSFALEASAASPPETARAKVDEARALIKEALDRIRALSFDLRPALLDHLGLAAALRGLIERYTAGTGVRVNFQQAGLDGRLPPPVETAAYRIVQEALTNVARHARVPEVVVRLWRDADALAVQVEDQGVGFHPEAVLARGRSSGLPGMHERVLLLGGRPVVESAPGSGTHLFAELPVTGVRGRNA